jgi:hypothetical protein
VITSLFGSATRLRRLICEPRFVLTGRPFRRCGAGSTGGGKYGSSMIAGASLAGAARAP